MGRDKRGRAGQIIGYSIAALFFGLIAVSSCTVEYALQHNGVEVPARVVTVDESGEYGSFDVEFTTRTGRTIRTEVNGHDWDGDLPKAGQPITITYDPDMPDLVGQPDRSLVSRYLLTVTLGCASMGMLWGALYHVRRRRRRPPVVPVPGEFSELTATDTTSTWPDGLPPQHRDP